MSIIEASSVRVSTMADGTLRLVVDIEPRNARSAFDLFGAPGTAIAIAALKDLHRREPEPEPEPAPAEKPKGGALAKLAGMWCEDARFQAWLKVADAHRARAQILLVCGIDSRAELDHNAEAAHLFNECFRMPYQKHLISIGAVADHH